MKAEERARDIARDIVDVLGRPTLSDVETILLAYRDEVLEEAAQTCERLDYVGTRDPISVRIRSLKSGEKKEIDG